MKLIIATLNVIMVGWLLLTTPIVQVGAGVGTASKYAELSQAGVINQDKMSEYQKQTKAPFRPDNIKSIGEWLAKDNAYVEMLLLPCGLFFAVNALFLLAATSKRKKMI